MKKALFLLYSARAGRIVISAEAYAVAADVTIRLVTRRPH